jgi:hypothetical protein
MGLLSALAKGMRRGGNQAARQVAPEADDFIAKTRALVDAMPDEEVMRLSGGSSDPQTSRRIIYETLVKQEMLRRSGNVI